MSSALQQLVGESPTMQYLRQQIKTLSQYDIPIHIQGESGVGKELVACALHQESLRCAKAFVPVNCAAIPDSLVESEWFGHRAGSFSSASHNRPGLFRTASRGTLFLDEIAELSLASQVKLLRVLQEQRVRAVGADCETAVDVRWISASHQDLSACVTKKHFRADLYYRIVGVSLVVPPLRQRLEDLHVLVPQLLDRLQQRWQLPPIQVAANAWPLLAAYDYPGNVRELEQCLVRAALVKEAFKISSFSLKKSGFRGLDSRCLAQFYAKLSTDSALKKELLAAERSLILAALKAHGGHRAHAAKALGLSVRAMRYRLQKLGLNIEI